jgi:hypothetical protein
MKLKSVADATVYAPIDQPERVAQSIARLIADSAAGGDAAAA